MWGSPLEGRDSQGDKINVIVIDTEGIGALDEDSNHDTKVFSLAVLISSLFIYNRYIISLLIVSEVLMKVPFRIYL
jgi:hypothetical protein